MYVDPARCARQKRDRLVELDLSRRVPHRFVGAVVDSLPGVLAPHVVVLPAVAAVVVEGALVATPGFGARVN